MANHTNVETSKQMTQESCVNNSLDEWDDLDDNVLINSMLDFESAHSKEGIKRAFSDDENSSARKKASTEKHKTTEKEDIDNSISNEEEKSVSEPKSDVAPLHRFRNGYLWVSDLTSQVWCEQKMVYSHTLPVIVEKDPIMTAGSNLHLARELAVQDVVKVSITSDEDIFAVKVLNLEGAVTGFLNGTPVRREIPIFGAPFDFDIFIVGMIDEIRCDFETFTFDILELKTRSTSKSMPSKSQQTSHILQVMIYKKLFDDIILGHITKEKIARYLDLDLFKEFGSDVIKHMKQQGIDGKNLASLLDYTFSKLQCVPKINQLLIEYCFQEDQSTIGIKHVDYDEEWLRKQLKMYMTYWKGHRESKGVDIEEAWKCQRCEFADVCDWRKQKADECMHKNSVTAVKHKP